MRSIDPCHMQHARWLSAVLLVLSVTTNAAAQQCVLDPNNDKRTSIDELVMAINEALQGCPGGPVTATQKPTATPVPTKTPTPLRPRMPRLSNLHGALSANANLTAFCNSHGFTNGITVTADFTGDVVGGTLHAFSTGKPSGGTFNEAVDIPSISVGVDGSTLEYRACITPNQDTSLRVELQVVSPDGVNGNRPGVTFPI